MTPSGIEPATFRLVAQYIYIYVCMFVCVCVCVRVTMFNMIVNLYISLYVSLRVILNESKLVGKSTIKIIGNCTSNKCIYFVFDE